MEAQRISQGLTYRDLEARTGIGFGRVQQILTGRRLGTREELALLHQTLNSSDPAFLRFIQQQAVPFLRARLRS